MCGGVVTGSTALLLEIVPEIDTNLMIFFLGGREWGKEGERVSVSGSVMVSEFPGSDGRGRMGDPHTNLQVP